MDSDREASSANESDSDRIKDGPKSPASSRSVSQASSHGDAASYNSESPQSPDSRPNSSNSRRQSEAQSPDNRPDSPVSRQSEAQSPENRPDSPVSRPQSQNSSVHSAANNRSRSPSPHSEGPRSPSPYSSESPSALRNGSKRSASHSSRSSSNSPDRMSEVSNKSESSRGSRKVRKDANLEDGNSSDSSLSSMDSGRRKQKRFSKAPDTQDTQAEEISDGDMELDNDKDSVELKKVTESSIAHDADDLSDVSDLDESIGGDSDKEDALLSPKETDYSPKRADKSHRTEEGEEQLDFEAEDGECADAEAVKDKEEKSSDVPHQKVSIEISDTEEKKVSKKDDKEEPEEGEELEEGEVSDEDEVRPEETEPRPVCRFFSRGQCTWGASCRFLHPGVTDKGNYTMFEMIRPVVPGEFGREDRAAYSGRPDPPAVESAWERGLRTAKEMLRKSIKRKEQDIDFEEKKMNLSLAQEEFDKENGYYPRAPSPEPRYTRHPVPADYQVPRASTDEYFGRRQVIYETEYPPRDRARPTFREMPPSHRPHPDYRYEEEVPKQRRPKREVIVQRTVEERPARADDWSDPWMRSKSPGPKKGATGGGGGGKRSYSSGSSYSSSSSSRSSSRSSRSSYRSRSRSPRHHRNRTVRGAAGAGSATRGRHAVSPTLIVSERKAANERAALMNPPAPRKKAVSPGMMRAGAQNPPAPSTKVDGRRKLAAALARVKTRRKSSRSSSGSSSGSSSTDTDSSSSSSTSRDNSPPNRRAGGAGVDLALAIKAKELEGFKGNSDKKHIKLTLKNSVGRKPDAGASSKTTEPSSNNVKKRMASSPPAGDKNKKAAGASSRREELLKQLKAVEDAIAKKRSKVN